MTGQFRVTALAMLCASLATACGGGGDDSSAPGTGALSIGVTDAPVDGATEVVVKFTAIELKPEGASAILHDISPDKSIDLLALAGGDRALLLDGQSVPAGRYEWIRLLVEAQQNAQDGSYIKLDTGGQYPLSIPSGTETGLKLIRGFTVAAGGTTDFTIDFDLRKSVIAPPGQSPNYMLKPVLRLVNHLQVGRIEGTVAQSLVTDGCSPFVYVFSGSGVAPDDLDTAGEPDIDPLISVPVALDATSGDYRYRVAFLEPSTYTVSFTCDGQSDTPEGEETLTFTGTQDATVTANQATTIDFQ